MHVSKHQPSSHPTWAAVREELQKTVTAKKPLGFEMWFGDVTGRVEEGANGFILQLVTPTKVHTTRIKNEFLDPITQAWHHFVPDGQIVFIEQPPPAEKYLVPPDSAREHEVRFPAWADARRAAASAVFRSALFPALARGHRKYVENQKIFSTRGVEVFFTGKQFDQSDLDVYLEILHRLRDQPSGTKCTFTAYEMLKALSRSAGYRDYLWLHSVLIRLCGGVSDITDHQAHYFGPLLEGGIKDKLTKEYTIRVNPEFAALFNRSWSSLDHEQRKLLRGNPTAQALHAYYSGHVAPGPHEFATLAGLVGLTDKNLRKVRLKIKNAHEQMKAIGFLKSYEVTEDTIKVQIHYMRSQTRYLARKIVKERKRHEK